MSHMQENKSLSFVDFIGATIDWIAKHKLFVFVVIPLGVSIFFFVLGSYINGHWPRNFEEYAQGFALPVFVSIGAYMLLFCGDINHPAKGNEGAFGCALMIVILPIVCIAYALYRLIFSIRNIQPMQRNSFMDPRKNSIEDRVKRLNDLLDAKLITKEDYDKQLTRLIENNASSMPTKQKDCLPKSGLD